MPYYVHNLMYCAVLLSVTMVAGALALLLAPWSVVPAWLLAAGLVAYLLVGESVVYGLPVWKVAVKQLGLGFYGFFAFTLAGVLWLVVAVLFA